MDEDMELALLALTNFVIVAACAWSRMTDVTV